MAKRIAHPINQLAFNQAKVDFYKKYLSLVPNGQFAHVAPSDRNYKKYRSAWLKFYENAGGITENGWANGTPNDVEEPCPFKNKISHIEILDGDNNTYLTAAGKQHVNLTRENKWVENGTDRASSDRLGRTIRVKVRFEQASRQYFKVQLLAHNNNAIYSNPEKGARPAYNYVRGASPRARPNFDSHHGAIHSGRTEANGEKVIEIFNVPPAVLDQYMFVAWDKSGKEVQSHVIETCRTVFYMTIFTADAQGPVANAFEQRIEGVYGPLGTNLVSIGNETLAAIINWDMNAPQVLQDSVNDLCLNNSNKGVPYTHFSPHMQRFLFATGIEAAAPISAFPILGIPVGLGQADINVRLASRQPPASDPTYDMRKTLWENRGLPILYANDIRKSLDINGNRTGAQENNWLVSAVLEYTNGTTLDIPLANLTPIAGVNGSIKDIRVKVDDLPATTPTANIKIRVMVAGRSVLGLKFSGGPNDLLIGASLKEGDVINVNNQMSAMIHEMAHSLGMCGVENTGLEAHNKIYRNGGTHCREGLPDLGDQAAPYHNVAVNAQNALCLMYGHVCNPPLFVFCNDCAAVMRKVDVSLGFT